MAHTSVKTIDRLVEILNCFDRESPGWTLSALSRRLQAPKSTLHRFLVGLESQGIVRRSGDDARWRLGPQLLVWGALAADTTIISQVAAPLMRTLCNLTGETVLLTEYEDGHITLVEKAETSHSVRLAVEVGGIREPHAGASSKILLAFLPEAEVEAVIRRGGLPRLCERTITDPDQLRRELQLIRERGYAQSYEETDRGAWGIATPVRNWRSEVVAGLGIAGPTVRFSERLAFEYVRLCAETAARISALLGATALPVVLPQTPVQTGPSDDSLTYVAPRLGRH